MNVQTLVQFAQSKLKSLPAAAGANLPAGAVFSQTLDCNSGTISVTGNFAGETLAAGDSVTYAANNCYDQSTLTTYNGGFTISITKLTGDYLNSFVYDVGMTMTFNNFVAVSSASEISGSGSISLSETSTAMNTSNSVISASRFTNSVTYANASYQRELTDYIVNQAVLPNMPTSSYKITSSMSGTVSSTGLGGKAVTVSTQVPFVQLSKAAYPYTGQAVATGSSGSKVRLTAQSSTSVLIELDANGDNTYEASTVKNWSSL